MSDPLMLLCQALQRAPTAGLGGEGHTRPPGSGCSVQGIPRAGCLQDEALPLGHGPKAAEVLACLSFPLQRA